MCSGVIENDSLSPDPHYQTLLSFLIEPKDMTNSSRLLVPGIYAPLPTFYLDNDDQDLGEFSVE
jgi:hypothetical protein